MISWGFSTDQKMKIDLVLDLVIPPAMTALWIAFVRVNNRFSLRQIAPQPCLLYTSRCV